MSTCITCAHCFNVYPAQEQKCPLCGATDFFADAKGNMVRSSAESRARPQPHKHAAVIKAWADGAQIQFRSLSRADWLDYDGAQNGVPAFGYPSMEWRVKPSPPDFAKIARDAWYDTHATHRDGWKVVADAVIAAYKAEQKGGV